MKTHLLAVICGISFCATSNAQELSPTDQAVADAAMKVIRPEAIAAHMRFLSDDLLEGRQTGERGYEIAAHYVASQLESMGLTPGGANDTWFQSVPLRKVNVIPEQTSFELAHGGKSQFLALDHDYLVIGNPNSAEASAESELIFVGFGVTAPEFQYDDYGGTDVRGKVVVVLQGAPPKIPSTERAYFSDLLLKQRTAVAHGAVGALMIYPPEYWQSYPWSLLVSGFSGGTLNWVDSNGAVSEAVPEIRVFMRMSERGAEALFEGAPKTLPEVFAASREGKPLAFRLPVTVRIHTAVRFTAVESPNVIAKLPGSDQALAREYVVYSAHLDHLGVCRPEEKDPICHGAADNASGTAAVLEIARAFSILTRAPRRSILFLLVTGEEPGLLGSSYFTHFPTVPIQDIVADLNIDGAPGLFFPNKDIVPIGSEHSSLSRNVESAAHMLGYTISPDPRPEQVFFIRSDQYSFAKMGIPVIKLNLGTQSADPSIDVSSALKTLRTTYHTPQDNMSLRFYFDSTAKSTRLHFLIGYEVAQQSERPTWNTGDFFGVKFARKH